jgi:hypothetical protein
MYLYQLDSQACHISAYHGTYDRMLDVVIHVYCVYMADILKFDGNVSFCSFESFRMCTLHTDM